MNYRRLRREIVYKYWNVESDKVDRVCKKLNYKINGDLTVNRKIENGPAKYQYLCE